MTRPTLNQLTPYAVILLAALLATAPLLLAGPSCGHDLTFHLLNWMDAAHQWRSGTLRPWWCFPAAWNTGEPRFLFYPPLSWHLGALLTLVTGATRAPLAFTLLALTASGMTMRRFLAAYVSPPLALLGACRYLAHPYMLFTATERTAYAELLAAAWLPWLLHEALRTSGRQTDTGFSSRQSWSQPQPSSSQQGQDHPEQREESGFSAGRPGTLIATEERALLPRPQRRNSHGTATLTSSISAPRLAIPVALLWLTNTPAAVLAAYTLAAILAIRTVLAFRNRQSVLKPLLLPATLGYLWGLALSAIYLLPALVQHSAVEVNQAFSTGMRPEDSTLFTHTGEPFHDHVVHQASVLAVLLLATAATAATVQFLQQHRTRRLHGMRDLTLKRTHHARHAILTPTLLSLSAATLFLLTPASLPLWHHLPELRFLQFPWRTLMLQGIVTVTLVVLAIRTRLRMRWAVPVALAAVAAIGIPAHSSYAQTCDDEDAPRSLLAQYNRGSGFEPYDEYTPKDADNDLLHSGEPPAWTATDVAAAPTAAAASHAHTVFPAKAEGLTIQVQPTRTDRFLIVRQRRFRNWQVTLDANPIDTDALRDDDLLAIPLPDTRPHTVSLRYRWSFDQSAGMLVSALATLAIGAALRRPRQFATAQAG